jgi:hypothetical protein
MTSLVGAIFERRTANEHTWPSNFQPNASNEFLATVDAAWVDEDGSVKVAGHDPFGNFGDFWPGHHRFVRNS